jgi:hypothetical protein
MPQPSARDRFLALLSSAMRESALVRLTLGKYRGTEPALRQVSVRPVTLKAGPHLAFVWRYATRDVTKNLPIGAALAKIESLLGRDFLDAHLHTASQTAQLETAADGAARLRVRAASHPQVTPAPAHDRAKSHLIPATAPWLRALGVTNDRGQPREGMADKFRQIQKFAELLTHLMSESELPPDRPLTVVDMGSGKGYLTFAVADLLGPRARVRGIEVRSELVALCNRIAAENHFSERLQFRTGTIADTPLDGCDVLIALHACDTATDDALARGIAAGAQLLVVAPCCQKELRPQLTAPDVLAGPLRHGIFQERHAEFATDALRAELLEWAGYRTKVFEFVSTEHTAKNLMIAAIKARARGAPDDDPARSVRDVAQFYGIRSQALARQLGFSL